MLAHVFENFHNVWLKIYELDPAKFLTSSISMVSSLKSDWSEIGIITGIEILLIVKKGIRGEICMLFIDIQKLITNSLKIIIKKL